MVTACLVVVFFYFTIFIFQCTFEQIMLWNGLE